MQEILNPNENFQVSNDNTPQALPNATAVLVLGIISIATCAAWGIPGIICGIISIMLHKKDKALYLTNPIKYENSFKTSKAGNTCGVIGLVLSACTLLFVVIYLIFIVSIFTSVVSNLPHH